MLRFIILLILFYIVFKAVKYFLKYLAVSNRNSDSFKKNTPTESKYQDIEEADFKEIKKENEKENE